MYILSICIILACVLYSIIPSPFDDRVSYSSFRNTWNVTLYPLGEGEFGCEVEPFNWTAIVKNGVAYFYDTSAATSSSCDVGSEAAYKLELETGRVTNTCILPKEESRRHFEEADIKEVFSIPLLALPEKHLEGGLDIISILNYLYHEVQLIR